MNEFNQWNEVKVNTNKILFPPNYNEREVWWCKVGRNIGTEMNGKGEEYTRPVLILKKYSERAFIGIPLTHNLKVDKYHTSFYFNEGFSSLSLFQIKTFDSKRLSRRMGRVSVYVYEKVLRMIRNAF